MAPQAPLILRLRGWLWGSETCSGPIRPGGRDARRNIILPNAEGLRDPVGDAEELAVWLCNCDLGGRSRIGRRVSGQGCGWPLPGGGAGEGRRLGRVCREGFGCFLALLVVEGDQRGPS